MVGALCDEAGLHVHIDVVVWKLLGHSKIQTTARYAHLAQDSVKRSAAQVAASIGADILLEGSAPPAGGCPENQGAKALASGCPRGRAVPPPARRRHAARSGIGLPAVGMWQQFVACLDGGPGVR